MAATLPTKVDGQGSYHVRYLLPWVGTRFQLLGLFCVVGKPHCQGGQNSYNPCFTCVAFTTCISIKAEPPPLFAMATFIVNRRRGGKYSMRISFLSRSNHLLPIRHFHPSKVSRSPKSVLRVVANMSCQRSGRSRLARIRSFMVQHVRRFRCY